MTELKLPNPGNKRYWKVTDAGSGDLDLSMYEENGVLVVRDYVFGPESSLDVVAKANTLLNAARILSYVGTYTYDEEK